MPAAGPSIAIKLSPQNHSGESGTALLTQQGPDVVVVLHVKNTGGRVQPAHIHKGTCANLDPSPAYPLANVVNGSSTTRVRGVSLVSLVTKPFAINVHRSTTELAVYVSCGNIVPGDTPTGGTHNTGV